MTLISMRGIKAFVGIALSAICLGAIWFVKTALAPQRIDAPPASAITEIPPSLVATSFATRSAYGVASGTRILLIPHHLVAGREIASLLSSTATPTRVILLSPDHFSRGKTIFSFPKQTFSWQGKTIPTDSATETDLLHRLQPEAEMSETVFEKEHGVRGLLPFLATAWPMARILPLTVRNDATKDTLERLTAALDAALVDPETLVVFTIDFSHDLPQHVADLHDLLAEDALRSLDAEAVTDVEIDSRPLFWALTSLAGSPISSPTAGDVRIHAHTNALSLMKAKTIDLGTSHFLASFAPGRAQARTRSYTLVHDEHRSVTSKEGRFYQGFDAITTSTIPFPTAFVRIEGATSTEWRALPLKKVGSGWLPLNDQERNALPESDIGHWIAWAEQHLTADAQP